VGQVKDAEGKAVEPFLYKLSPEDDALSSAQLLALYQVLFTRAQPPALCESDDETQQLFRDVTTVSRRNDCLLAHAWLAVSLLVYTECPFLRVWTRSVQELCDKYPIGSIEDGFHEDDWLGFAALTAHMGATIQVVGDDLTVTNPSRIARAVEQKACNALLLKVNQIGTVSEALRAAAEASNAGWRVMVSHRSGETEGLLPLFCLCRPCVFFPTSVRVRACIHARTHEKPHAAHYACEIVLGEQGTARGSSVPGVCPVVRAAICGRTSGRPPALTLCWLQTLSSRILPSVFRARRSSLVPPAAQVWPSASLSQSHAPRT